MRELTTEEVKSASGAGLPAVGAAALTYKTAYETATWYGADELGEWLGHTTYDMMHGS